MRDILATQVNRFPCGHVDIMSYCRTCREALMSPAPTSALFAVAPVETAAERRDRLLKQYRDLEAQSARVGKGHKFALTMEREKILAEYRIAKKQAHIEAYGSRKAARDKLALLPMPSVVQDADDETTVPMRNADFLLYVRRRVVAGATGPIPRPRVKAQP